MQSASVFLYHFIPLLLGLGIINSSSLDWEDTLEKGMASHSSILAWKISWTEEPGGLRLQQVEPD